MVLTLVSRTECKERRHMGMPVIDCTRLLVLEYNLPLCKLTRLLSPPHLVTRRSSLQQQRLHISLLHTHTHLRVTDRQAGTDRQTSRDRARVRTKLGVTKLGATEVPPEERKASCSHTTSPIISKEA